MNFDLHSSPNELNLEPIHIEQTISYYDGKISLKSGVVKAENDDWHRETLFDGLKIIVIDNDELLCKLPYHSIIRIVGPCVCAIWNRGNAEGCQSFPAGCSLRYTIITLSADTLLNIFAESLETLDDQFDFYSNKPKLITVASSQSIRALCSQISICPFEGRFRNMYLSGKALELAAHVLETIHPSPYQNTEIKLNAADLDRIYKAKDILIEQMQDPPSLPKLALLVGMSTKKLTMSFRKIFGDSVFGYLQTLRLNAAYRLLVEGELSVSSIAYQIGYTPAHLSVVFRKQFGMSPKDIQR